MTKRRRERDKPKSGPESLYNPNKRVLLSYASDEEEAAIDDALEQTNADAAEIAVDDRTLANYQMTEYLDSEDESVLGAVVDGNGASEREDEGTNEVAEDVEVVEVTDDEATSAAQMKTIEDRGPPTKRDPATAQRPTLGPASYSDDEDEDEDEEYDPETEEAMAYLRAVRSVATRNAYTFHN